MKIECLPFLGATAKTDLFNCTKISVVIKKNRRTNWLGKEKG